MSLEGLNSCRKHRVDYNVLCVLNRHNADYPVELYRYFKEIGAEFIQFIRLSNISPEHRSRSARFKPDSTASFCVLFLTSGW